MHERQIEYIIYKQKQGGGTTNQTIHLIRLWLYGLS